MSSSTSQETDKTFAPERYEGLDAFRVLSSFYVVFGHVYTACRSVPELEFMFRALTFGFPFIVMSSFFVMTRSMAAKPKLRFVHVFFNSAKRLWLPFFVWTAIYSVWLSFIYPAMRGNTPFYYPPLTRLLSGYMHLWFLEFLFIGSLVLYLMLAWSRRRKLSRIGFAVLCVVLTVVGEILVVVIFNPQKGRFSMADVFPDADDSLNVFINGIVFHVFFVLPAVCLGLYADEINKLFQKRVYRVISLVFALVCALVYMTVSGVPYLREVYTLAIFLVALQPWKISSNWVRLVATYSYAIYILHSFPVEFLYRISRHFKVEFTAAFVLFWSVIIYAATLIAAILLRKIFPFDWFLPLISAGYYKKPRKQTE